METSYFKEVSRWEFQVQPKVTGQTVGFNYYLKLNPSVRKSKNVVPNHPCVIDGICDRNEIVNFFSDRYRNVLDNPECQIGPDRGRQNHRGRGHKFQNTGSWAGFSFFKIPGPGLT